MNSYIIAISLDTSHYRVPFGAFDKFCSVATVSTVCIVKYQLLCLLLITRRDVVVAMQVHFEFHQKKNVSHLLAIVLNSSYVHT